MTIFTNSIPPASQKDFALWLIVPVKPFGEGKSRLATLLSPEQRAEISHRWLAHLLNTASKWGRFFGIAVISRDPIVLTMASALGALPIVETGEELNEALTQASAVVEDAGATGVLMLPSDLPLLTSADLDELYNLALTGDGIIISPSHDGGTNALLLRPPHAIRYSFGEGSFDRHLALATEVGLPYYIYRSPSLALDIDHPEDLFMANERT